LLNKDRESYLRTMRSFCSSLCFLPSMVMCQEWSVLPDFPGI